MEDAVVPNDEDIYDEIMIDDYVRLASAIDPLQNEILEIEGVEAENEGVESYNEGVDDDSGVTVNAYSLPPEKNVYHLWNPPTFNCNDEISNQRSMGWINLIIGARALHNIAKAYVKVFNVIDAFVEPNSPTNIITNETILTQYSIKQGLKNFDKKARLQC